MSLRLVPLVTQRAAAFEAVALRPGVTFVGRTDDNGICLKSNLVSRRHAKLIFTDMGLTVHDLDSHNGIFLNGKKVRSTPVSPGDILYFADVCVGVEAVTGADATFEVESSLNRSSLVNVSMEGADEPAARNLAAIVRISDLLVSSPDDVFFGDALATCRELTEASAAVFIRRRSSGELETPVILREGTPLSSEAPVSWPVVRRCVDEKTTLFSRDVAADPLIQGSLLSSGEGGAVMCVPIIIGDRAAGAIYLTRPFAGEGFTDREVETLSAIAHLFGLRLRADRVKVADATSVRALGDTDEGLGMRTAEERSALESELKEAQRRLAEQEAALSERAVVDAQLAEAKARIAKLEGRIADSEKALSAGDKDREEAEGALGLLRARLEEEQALTAKLREDLAASARHAELAEARLVAADQADADRERTAAESARAHQEIARLTQEVARATHAARTAEEALAAARAEIEAAAQAARAPSTSGAFLPAPLRERLEAVARGEAQDDQPRMAEITTLVVALAGVDAWAKTASVDDVKARLDAFTAKVASLVATHGGTVDSTVGHAQVALFAATGEGVRQAVDCAMSIVEEVPADDGGVHCGLHVGPSTHGFFGDADAPVYLHFGEAIAIARGVCDYARPGTVWVTDGVRERLGDETDVMLIATGPHLVREFRMNPINLFQVGPRG